jgi:hypothetical protein
MIAKNDRLLGISRTILRLLLDKDTTTNKLQKQTTTDKTFFYDVRNQLRKEKLIIVEQLKGPQGGKGFEMAHRLSELGRQIAELYKEVENFQICHKAFRQVRLSKFDKSITKIKRYDENNKPVPFETKRALDQKNRPIAGAQLLELLSFEYFNDIIFYKCARLLLKVSKKDLSYSLIQLIITITMEYYLEEITHLLDTKDPGFVDNLTGHIDIINEIPITAADYLLLTNSHIRKEMINLLHSLFSVLPPNKDYINEIIEDTNNQILRYGPSASHYLTKINNLKIALEFYKNFL